MAGTSQSDKGADNTSAIDLSDLEALNFGPDWTSGKSITTNARAPREGGNRGGDRRGPTGGKPPARRDRRPARPARKDGDAGAHQQRGGGHRRGDRRPMPEREEYEPVLEVLFYPEDIPFKALIHAIKTSCRTYELFELARLILSKSERFVAVMKPLPGLAGSIERFVVSVPDGMPFESEEAAMAHVLQAHVDKFFTTEDVEIDPPKGSFQMVNRCSVTGELLGPPNYHRYQALATEHHAKRLSNMSFERFSQKIESIKEQEVIDEWLKKMSCIVRYKVISPREGEPEALDGLEAAKHFLLSKRRSEVIREADQVRISGKAIEQLPDGPIAKSARAVLDKQLRFPLDTANNLRGRLRRMHFTIYKRGAKGVSFVCAVKRAFRESRTVFSESLQELIDFIENHQYINVSELPDSFLGIALESAAVAPPPPEKAPAIEKVSEEDASKIVEAHEKQRIADQEDEAKAEPSTETPEASAAETPAAESSSEQTAPAVALPVIELTAEQTLVRQLFADLRWLVTEGYVTEFGDGRLFVNPAAPEPKPKAAKPEAAKGDAQAEVETSAKGDSQSEADAVAESVEAKAPDAVAKLETPASDEKVANSETAATNLPSPEAVELPQDEPVKPEVSVPANTGDVVAPATKEELVATPEVKQDEVAQEGIVEAAEAVADTEDLSETKDKPAG